MLSLSRLQRRIDALEKRPIMEGYVQELNRQLAGHPDPDRFIAALTDAELIAVVQSFGLTEEEICRMHDYPEEYGVDMR